VRGLILLIITQVNFIFSLKYVANMLEISCRFDPIAGL